LAAGAADVARAVPSGAAGVQALELEGYDITFGDIGDVLRRGYNRVEPFRRTGGCMS